MSSHCLLKGEHILPLEIHQLTGPILLRETGTGFVPVGTTNRDERYAVFEVGAKGDEVYYVHNRAVDWDNLTEADKELSIDELTPPQLLNHLWQLQYGRLLARSEGVNAFVLNGVLEEVLDRGTTSYPDLLDLLFSDDDSQPAIRDHPGAQSTCSKDVPEKIVAQALKLIQPQSRGHSHRRNYKQGGTGDSGHHLV